MGRILGWVVGLVALTLPLASIGTAHAQRSHLNAQMHTIHGSLSVTRGGSSAPANVYLGVSVHQWSSEDLLANLAQYQREAGKNAALVMYWRDWAAGGQIEPDVMQAIYGQGSVPVISWSPGCWSCSDQSAYSLDHVLAGDFDGYIRSFAGSLAAYKRPVLLRFGPEMNGCWDTYSCQPSKFVAVWRHIHDLFAAQGATNVQWVWCPNIDWDGHHPFAAYYPGNAYVNWLGLDGYNKAWSSWQRFDQIIGSSMKELTAINGSLPVMVGETASSDATPAETQRGQTKAAWITDTYSRAIGQYASIRAVVWFDQDKSSEEHCPCNWQVDSSQTAMSAFATAVAAPQYLSKWS